MSGSQQLILGEGAGSGVAANYIEDVFSTWLITVPGSQFSINNGIDLSTKGGMVWIKDRSLARSNTIFDTVRGTNSSVSTDLSNSADTSNQGFNSFNTNGFTITPGVSAQVAASTEDFVYWTFREQQKFFDVVTYTGTGSARTVAHNLGSVPGCIIIKRLNGTSSWQVFHRSTGNTRALFLNGASPGDTAGQYWNNTSPTSTDFTVGFGSDANANGGTYVAYLFAHDAGGFGLTGTDNVITCGSFTTNSGGSATVNLGYEPQWLLVKNTSSSENWYLVDNMRGWPADTSANQARVLYPNLSNAETNFDALAPTSTGFVAILGNTQTYIYVAIRRGPMKTPTTGTSVFTPLLYTGNNTNNRSLGGFGNRPDTAFLVDRNRDGYSSSPWVQDRLRGPSRFIATNSTAAEANASSGLAQLWNDNVIFGSTAGANWNSSTFLSDGEIWAFTRAPGFFDEVCYTGTGSATSFTHNLGAVPQLMIVKGRSSLSSWHIYDATNGATNYMRFNNDPSTALSTIWNNTAPTSTQFTVGTSVGTNSSGQTYVAYLFATVSGVSRVGSYTGTGALQTVNCGFTGGARFVLIKRTDAGGDWWVYDSARGISSGNDPYIFLNTSDPEVTGTNYVDTTGVGFQVTAAAPAGLNANGGTYIFLAIA